MFKLTIQTPERCHWHPGVFIVNFEHISHLALVFLLKHDDKKDNCDDDLF